MTPEEVKKRFEKAIEAMFASASRQLGDIENKALDVIDSLIAKDVQCIGTGRLLFLGPQSS